MLEKYANHNFDLYMPKCAACLIYFLVFFYFLVAYICIYFYFPRILNKPTTTLICMRKCFVACLIYSQEAKLYVVSLFRLTDSVRLHGTGYRQQVNI